MSPRVAVVGGGPNSEHAVSLASADSVTHTLRSSGFDVLRLDLGRSGGWRGETGGELSPTEAVRLLGGCDVLFPMVHGPGGEDGTVAGFADLLGLPCVGSGVGAGAVAMDKWVTKLVAGELGVRVADGRLVTGADVGRWPGPCVVKPVAAGSSQGVALVTRAEDWEAALERAFAEDSRVLVEEVLTGREIDIAVLRRADGTLLLSPPLEVRAAGFFDYDAKYDGSTEFVVPAPLTASELSGLEELAATVFTGLGCAGVARVDFFLTDRGWVLNEVNTVPGMTEHSQVPRMFAATGLDHRALLTELVAAARPRPALR